MGLTSWFKRGKEEAKQEPQQSIPRGEISFRDPLLYPASGKYHWAPYNPDIFVQRKGGLEIYEKMRRDEQIKSCQWIKRLSVLCSGWDIEPVSQDQVDVEAADFCKDNLGRLKGTLEEKIKEILTGMDFGFSVSEKVFGFVEDGDFRGKIGLKALKTRKPHRWDFETDAHGNLTKDGLWQLNGQFKYEPNKFVIYSHNKEFDNWYGTSDLNAAYRAFWSKDNIIKFWNIFLERFGMGIPRLKPSEPGGKINDPVFTQLKNAIFNLQNASALAWDIPGIDVDILESKRRGTGEYDKAIQYYDRAISRALLQPTGLGMSEDDSKGGSFARSQTHFNLWLWIMLDLRKTVEETVMNEQVIPDLVNYNFSVGKYPKYRFQPMDQPEKLELGKLWLDAVKGKAVHPDAEDELHLRRLIEFPERDRDELEDEIEDDKLMPSIPDISTEDDDLGDLHGDKPLRVVNQRYAKWHRPLTKFEKRVDFAGVEKNLNRLEDEVRVRLKGILEKQRDKLLARIEKATNDKKIDMNWVNALNPQYGVEFQAVVKEFMRSVFEVGRSDARREIDKARRKKHQAYIIKMPPKEVIGMLEKSSFWIRNVTFDGITKGIQALLFNMLDTGETPGETLMKIRQVYDPYVGDVQKVIDQRQIEPYRIETLIRNNSTKAYNRAKVVEFVDPELEGFVRAAQVSAVLDTRTTDICRSVDGKIILVDDPLLKRFIPGLHHQCRTILVPVTEADGVFEVTKQKDLSNILDLMPPDFGGNLDR
jgi:SPP1 gp7 family putative phage head morphogenesis protein